MDPRYTVILGTSASGSTVPVAFTVDPGKVLLVTSPNWFVNDAGSGLQLHSEAQSYLVNVLEPFFNFTSSDPTGLLTASLAYAQGFNSGDMIALDGADTTVDSFAGASGGLGNGDGPSLMVLAQNYAWNGASYDRVRIANIFHTVIATALGSTPVWTPTAGKSFRLMGYTIDVAGTMAATGVNTIKLEDGATVIKNHLANCIQTPTASISGGADHIQANLGQGQLSAAAGNVLNVNLSVAMATGGVAVNVWGCEE